MHVQSCRFAYFDVLVAVVAAIVPFTSMLFQGSEKDDSEGDPESDYAPSEDDDEDESSQSEYSSETETSESGSGKDVAWLSVDIFIYCCFSNNVYNPRHKENDNHTYIYSITKSSLLFAGTRKVASRGRQDRGRSPTDAARGWEKKGEISGLWRGNSDVADSKTSAHD